jgi:hypothetical protein
MRRRRGGSRFSPAVGGRSWFEWQNQAEGIVIHERRNDASVVKTLFIMYGCSSNTIVINLYN